jgi:polyketide biosynthesis acyl carrier protein
VSPADLVDVIGSCTRDVLPELGNRRFAAHENLESLGANSMDRAEIVMRVLDCLDLRMPRTETLGPRNIGELAELLHARLAQR